MLTSADLTRNQLPCVSFQHSISSYTARIICKNCKSGLFTCPLKPNQWCPAISEQNNLSVNQSFRFSGQPIKFCQGWFSPTSPFLGHGHSVPQLHWPYFTHWAWSTLDCLLLRALTYLASPACNGSHFIDWVRAPSINALTPRTIFSLLNSW